MFPDQRRLTYSATLGQILIYVQMGRQTAQINVMIVVGVFLSNKTLSTFCEVIFWMQILCNELVSGKMYRHGYCCNLMA